MGGPPAQPDWVTGATPSLPSTRSGRTAGSPSDRRLLVPPPPRGEAGAERIPGTISTREVCASSSFRVAPGDAEYGTER